LLSGLLSISKYKYINYDDTLIMWTSLFSNLSQSVFDREYHFIRWWGHTGNDLKQNYKLTGRWNVADHASHCT